MLYGPPIGTARDLQTNLARATQALGTTSFGYAENDFNDTAALTRFRSSAAGTGAVTFIDTDGSGVVKISSGNAAGVAEVDSTGAGGNTNNIIKNIRGKWYMSALIIMPATFDANTRISIGISDTTAGEYCGCMLWGATSTTIMRFATSTGSFSAITGGVASTKTQSSVSAVDAEGRYRLFTLRSDGTNVIGSVDNEPEVTGPLVTTLTSGGPGYFAIRDYPAAGTHVDYLQLDYAFIASPR
jgi:hypothetical protein